MPRADPCARARDGRGLRGGISGDEDLRQDRERRGRAIAHINKYGTHHSDSIVTNDAAAAEKFLNEVDSAAVYRNASTRFTDGFEFGLGAEMGISTQKLHARGPMGLRELTSYKYIVRGNGQVRG